MSGLKLLGGMFAAKSEMSTVLFESVRSTDSALYRTLQWHDWSDVRVRTLTRFEGPIFTVNLGVKVLYHVSSSLERQRSEVKTQSSRTIVNTGA